MKLITTLIPTGLLFSAMVMFKTAKQDSDYWWTVIFIFVAVVWIDKLTEIKE